MIPEALRAALAARCKHFDAERSATLFDADQPGVIKIDGQGAFPCARMANGKLWFYDRTQRPIRPDSTPMSARAPSGARHLLCGPAAEDLILVEGEGHAVALTSIGFLGVVACGGVHVFTSLRAWAEEELRRSFWRHSMEQYRRRFMSGGVPQDRHRRVRPLFWINGYGLRWRLMAIGCGRTGPSPCRPPDETPLIAQFR